ncbi:hypothetical protein SZ25_00110 [Candidatus Arcanobacter lacustris]|uniref:Peptidase M15C domain-containing protein n=1 Tax=Candidatus Arcanibacter lacustris TaxID=1607817 RepID=A0A0F5MQ44_9RICK|nr:hypothetical protein SZ25_00110 [Candidatus Arcanobacter lacustris]
MFKKIILMSLLMSLPSHASANTKKDPIFSISAIPNHITEDMVQKNIWNEKCPVGIKRLKLLNLSYYDFEGNHHQDGKMIIIDAMAEKVLAVFKELHKRKFPIAKIKLINDYNGDDELSMIDNNTSAFICREVTGGGRISLHSYGVAIDVNPVQNPYISINNLVTKVSPKEGANYINRTNIRAGMVEPVVDVFTNNGFSIWGGTWNDPVDWMHFQLTRAEAENLSDYK